MTVPDSLSRKPKTKQDIDQLLKIGKTDDPEDGTFTIPIVVDGKTQKVLLTLDRSFQNRERHETLIPIVFDYNKDVEYGPIYNRIKRNDPQEKVPSDDLYIIEKGNLIWVDKKLKNRKCVPKKYRAALMAEYHDSVLGAHLGIDKTLAKLQQNFIWPFMKEDVRHFILSCDACQKNKARHIKPHGLAQVLKVPMEPWEHISIDFCGPFPKTKKGWDYICAIICNLTRMVSLVPCNKTITSKGAAQLYLDRVLSRFGLSKYRHSDRGPQFLARFWTCLWEMLGIDLAPPTIQNPIALWKGRTRHL